MIITFQDFEKNEAKREKWIGQAIEQYMRSDEYKLALEADEYEKQKNKTINEYVRLVYDITGTGTPDFTSTNNRIASNFFHRLNTERVSYSLGNGVSFANRTQERMEDNSLQWKDSTKDALGQDFDDAMFRIALYACEHGRCYCFYNDGEYNVFPMTEFMPLLDEVTGQIRAGLRFWSLDWSQKPIVVDVYEEDGYSRYMTKKGKYGLGALELTEEKRPYKETVQVTEADGEEVIGGENYPTIPIAVMYGNRIKQSTLVGMKANIDAYDLIHSGYANDLTECAQMYWIINNAAGMDEGDIARLRDRMLLQHIVVADTTNSPITPYAQEIPYQSREACLNRIKVSIYRDFGVIDVDNISTQNVTATQIRAAYQAMDEEADAFEYQVNQFIQQILKLIGIEDYPIFDRNKITNELEETQQVMMAAQYLDEKTLLEKLPFITVDEVDGILFRKGEEGEERFEEEKQEGQEENPLEE